MVLYLRKINLTRTALEDYKLDITYGNWEDPLMNDKFPQVIYKYRDWSISHHRKSLFNCEIWFSAPKQLNDPYDIRIPIQFDYREVEHPDFIKSIQKVMPFVYPEARPGSYEYKIISENFHELIKESPKSWFEKNLELLRENEMFDVYGVFSASNSCLLALMWGYYANGGQGICLGFDPNEIKRALKCGFGNAMYIGTPIVHSLLKGVQVFDILHLFIKGEAWSHEEEFRVITFVENDTERLIRLPPKALKKVILGYKISDEDKSEVIRCLKDVYHSQVKLYQIVPELTGFKFKKKEVSY